MKKLSISAVALLLLFSFQACNDSASTDPVKSANETNEVKQDSAEHPSMASDSAASAASASKPVSEEDSKFAVQAASGGMMEVQLGQLAQQKAVSQRVKNFGAMMVRDHTKANDELKSLAGMKNVTLPPAPGASHMQHIKDVTQKSGKDFDKAYMSMMLSDHNEDIDAFEKASKDGADADIKAFATKTLPVLRVHLDSAKAINEAMK